ncbi:MAG: hypothetical protein K8R90_06145 [Candidatus Cloacimonetes bacterium]|nr:hypothetical protein [Candidatus Cloacimonadota bacterium]
MRPIERKIFNKIGEKGITLDGVEEILDRIDRTEKKKSFPDESHFQSDRYFAKIIIDSLLRRKLIRREGSRFIRPDKEKKDTDE